jgi:hypothetical protein
MLKGSEWLELIRDLMRKRLLAQGILHADETTLQVLKEPGRAAEIQILPVALPNRKSGPADRALRLSGNARGPAPEGLSERVQGTFAD